MWRRKKSRAREQPETLHVAQQCPGDCFDIEAIHSNKQADTDLTHPTPSSTTTAKQYLAYTDISSWQTRLIRLLPNLDEKAILKADLLVVNIIAAEGVVVTSTNQNVTYDTLSYCWGNGPRNTLIELNGNDFAISSNLQAALRSPQGRTRTRYLWVDAICINQDDDEERAVQVVTMLDILHKAVTVHAWLGEPSEDSGLAIASLNDHYSLL